MKVIFALSAVLKKTLSFQTNLFYVKNLKLANYLIVNITNQYASCLWILLELFQILKYSDTLYIKFSIL